MWTVAAALIPAGGAAVFAFGGGVLIQLAAAVAAAILSEAACLVLRKKSVAAATDGSAMVCGIIVGLSMPPLAPWWTSVAAAAAGIALAKHCYGGLGNNPFKPRNGRIRPRLCLLPRRIRRMAGRRRIADSFNGRATFLPLRARRCFPRSVVADRRAGFGRNVFNRLAGGGIGN